MTLIVSKDGTTVRLERQAFENEAALQQYIYDNPEAIPLDEVSPGAKLFAIAREFPTDSGPIDVLAIDQGGHPYLIETKLFKNPDKRVVLAQVLDYGAALWANPPSPKLLAETLRQDAAKRGQADRERRLMTFLDSDGGPAESHLIGLADALADGRFTAIVLMDRLTQRLRDLISFLNDKSRFQVLAVELDYYRHDGGEIVSPRLYGAEARRSSSGRAASAAAVDPETFLATFEAAHGTAAADAWRRLADAALKSGVPGITVSHRPSGGPYLWLSESPVGSVYLFRLAGHKPEIRDDLFRNADVFEAGAEAMALRERFRSEILNGVPGAYRGGSGGRVYASVEAAGKASAAVVDAVAAFARSLGSLAGGA